MNCLWTNLINLLTFLNFVRPYLGIFYLIMFQIKAIVTPLLIATKEGHTEVVRELLQYNAQLEATGLLMVEKEYRRVTIY